MLVLRRLPPRLLWVMALCAAGAASFVLWQRRNAPVAYAPSPPPEWPPFPAPPAPAPGTAPAATAPAATAPADTAPAAAPAAAPAWVAPVDGACPAGYPVKVKASSGIYHVPGGRFYDRTVPDRCYADPAAAEADGYRASKS